jgi:hypothetical protein
VTALYGTPDRKPVSTIERLLESSGGPMNSIGTMRPAFTDESRGWEALRAGKTPEQLGRLEAVREGERLALLDWVRAGAPRDAYDRDDFPLGGDRTGQPVTRKFLVEEPRANQPARARIRSLINHRCVACHGPTGRVQRARLFPLDSHDRLKPHCRVEPAGGMSTTKLAQTTHVHLLSFAVLFGLTGLSFSLTSYPGPVRAVAGCGPLVLQVAEIACWWLGRLDVLFARAIVVLGPLVALGLAVQVLGGLWDLFGRRGKVALAALLVAACLGAGLAKVYWLDPHLEREKSGSAAQGVVGRSAAE